MQGHTTSDECDADDTIKCMAISDIKGMEGRDLKLIKSLARKGNLMLSMIYTCILHRKVSWLRSLNSTVHTVQMRVNG